MELPFVHRKCPGRMVWYPVPVPFPPKFRIPFPIELVDKKEALLAKERPGVTMAGAEIRIAEFMLSELVVRGCDEGSPCYVFMGWA